MPTSIQNPQFTLGGSVLADHNIDIVAASLTMKQGDLFYKASATGRLTAAAAAGANVAASVTISSMAIYAIDTALDIDTEIHTHPCKPRGRAIMSLCNDDAVAPWLDSYRGKEYEIRRCTTTGFYAVNINATTNTKVRVVSPIKNTVNDACALVEVEFL